MSHKPTLLLATLLLAACTKIADTPVTSVALDKTSLEINRYQTIQLVATVEPENATDKTVAYESSNPTIVSVDENGLIKAENYGIATVTASSGNESASCEILVFAPNIGDYYYSDGTYSEKIDADKTVIGIVFQTYQNNPKRFGDAEKASLAAKGITEPMGLVISCKEAGNSIRWSTDGTTDISGLKNCLTFADSYNDISGLGNTNVVLQIDNSLASYPAFKKTCLDFNERVPAPLNSTGWFLPSTGQLWDVVANLAMSPYLSSPDTQSSSENMPLVEGGQGNALENLNSWMKEVIDSQKDEFPKDQKWIWSSSEYSAEAALDWDLTSFGFLSSNFLSKTLGGAGSVRAVLAF